MHQITGETPALLESDSRQPTAHVAPTAGTRDGRLVVAITGAATALLALMAIGRVWTYRSSVFDGGYLDNVLWMVANGHGDVTAISGLHHFADHVSPLLLLFTPIYRFVPQFGLPALLAAQAVSVGLVGWAVWRIGGTVGLERRTRWALFLVTMLGPGAYYSAMTEVHASGLALGPLAMLVAGGLERRRLSVYWVWPLLAAMARIELALAVVIAGVLLIRTPGARRHGTVAAAIGGAVTFAMLTWMMFTPWEGTSVSAHFWHLDGVSGLADLPGAFLGSPIDVLRPLTDGVALVALLTWFVYFMAMPPLRGWRWILPAVPFIAIPLLGSWPAADPSFEHYWHVLLPMLAIASAFGLAADRELARLFVLAAPILLILAWVMTGPFGSPRSGFAPPPIGRDTSAERSAVALVNADPSASVAGSFDTVPHIAHRTQVTVFPTPFVCPSIPLAIFLPPPEAPDYVIVDQREERAVLEEDRPRVERILAEYYTVALEQGPITVFAKRTEPPPDVYTISCNARDALERIMGESSATTPQPDPGIALANS